MTQPISAADIDRFRDGIARCLGLGFAADKLGFLADVLRRRLEVAKAPPELYLARLEAGNIAGGEIAALSQELTIPETYFFRNSEQFRAFAEVALANRRRTPVASHRLRILSAGCASGEEAYSLAAIVREAALDHTWDVSILGVDVNPAMVKKARQARFSHWALRDTPADVRGRWFRREGREFVLDQTVQSAVRFEERNLVVNDPQLWQPDAYDIIFFRNVLMYFTAESGRTVIRRMVRSLRAGGYLFLGHAETLRGLSDDFQLRHTHGTFYYQLKDPLERLTPLVSAVVPRGPPPEPRPTAAKSSWTLEAALDLVRDERLTEALDTLQHLPADTARGPDLLLLRAALLTQCGPLVEAEAACKRLLDVDELSAGAHYLLALCRESARDLAGAKSHDQVAIRLDPGFAMPHLHLGLLARRAGDRAAAQNELGQALPLLLEEHPSRVLLFGGGFSRETLVALCRTELTGSGDQS